MTIFDNEYVISSSQPMNCREHLFNISLKADAEPGDYRLQVSEIHQFTNTGRPRPANNVFFFLSGKLLYKNICVDFLLQQFHTLRVRLTFRTSNTEKRTEKS